MSTISPTSQTLEAYMDDIARETSAKLIETLNQLIEWRRKYIQDNTIPLTSPVASRVELSVNNALHYPPNKFVLEHFIQRGFDFSYTSYRVPVDISHDIATPLIVTVPATSLEGVSNDVAIAFGYVITWSDEEPAQGKRRRGAQRGNPRRFPKAEIQRIKPY